MSCTLERLALTAVAALLFAAPASQFAAPPPANADGHLDGRPHRAAGPAHIPWDAGFGQSCKPAAPIEVDLAALGEIDVNGRVDLEFSVRSHGRFDDLHWHVELPGGAELQAGLGPASLRAGRGALSRGGFGVRLPSGASASYVTLVVTGTLHGTGHGTGDGTGDGTGQGTDGPERVQVRRTLWWGQPPAPGVERLLTIPGGRRITRLAELPASHRPGR